MLKMSNLNIKHEPGTSWPMEKKLEVVTQFLACGNMRIVSAATGVPYQLIRLWKTQQWWKEYEFEIKNAKRSRRKNTFSEIIDKSLDIIADRLENGEMILNNKTGELMRKPVSMKDTVKVTNDLLNQQNALEKSEQNESSLQKQDSIEDTLKQLANEFAKFNGKNKPQIIEAEDVEFKEAGETEEEPPKSYEADLQGKFEPTAGW